MNVYALYEGDRSICDGTIYQIAEMTGLKPATLKWCGTPSGLRKGSMALVRTEEDDDMLICSSQPRSTRSFEGRPAIPPYDSYYPAERTQTICMHGQPAERKPEPYARMLFDACFKNWKE